MFIILGRTRRVVIAIQCGYAAEPVRFRYVANVQSSVAAASKTKKRGKTASQVAEHLARQEAISDVQRGLNSYYYG